MGYKHVIGKLAFTYNFIFSIKGQAQPFGFVVIFLSVVITVLEILYLIICVLFVRNTEFLVFEAHSDPAQLAWVNCLFHLGEDSFKGNEPRHMNLR